MTELVDKTDIADLHTVADWVRFAATSFARAGLHFGHGTATAADEARALVWHELALDFDAPDYFYAARVTASERERLLDAVRRRVTERLPLPYLTGEAWFCGLSFEIDPRALIPRSPIGELIEARFEPWLRKTRGARILDMCTGSGCIAVAAAVYLDDARVDAADIDADALALAASNVARHGVGDAVSLYRSDLFEALPAARYDLIVCNPPYVPDASMASLPPEYRHEPAAALRADDGGLAIVARLLRAAPHYLADDGVLVLEVGESAARFEATWPALPVTWCEFERGGEGVMVIEAEALREHALAEREARVAHGR